MRQPNPSTYYCSWFVLCDKTFSGEAQYKFLLTPDREPMADNTKVQFGKPRSFMVVTYRKMSEGYGWGFTYRTRNDPRTTTSPKPTPAWMMPYKSWEHEAYHTAGRQLNSLENVLSKSHTPLPGSSASFLNLSSNQSILKFLFTTFLFSECLQHSFLLWKGLLDFIAYSGREESGESRLFQELPGALLFT